LEPENGATAGPSRPSLVINALSSWAGFAVMVVTGFLLTPFVIAHLGKNGYGIWSVVGSIIGYYGLLDLGVSSAVRRYVARYAARDDHDALNETIATAMTLFMAAGVVILAVSVFASGPLARFFRVGPGMVDDFRRVMILLGLAATVNLIGQVHRATIAAHELFVPRNVVMIAITVLRALLTVATLRAGWGLGGVALSHLSADGAGFVLHLALIRRLTPYVKLWPRCVRWPRLWELLGYGLTMTVIVAAGTLQIQAASIIVARFISLEAVAVYAVAALLARYFANLIHAGMGVLHPRFAGLDGLDDLGRLRSLMVKGLWVSTMLSCAVGLSLLVLGPRFLDLWVGVRFTPEELHTASTVLILLTVSSVLILAQVPGDSVLYAMNRHRVFAVIMVVEAVFNLGLSVLLAIQVGTVGVATGAVVAVVCVRTVAQPVYVSRVVGMSVVDYAYPIAVSIAAAAIVWVLWRWVLWPEEPQMGYGGLVLGGLAITASYGAVMLGLSAATTLAQGRSLRTAPGLAWVGAIRWRSSAAEREGADG
ncbi:MAG: lipopolysaccharide biosynthesis protein, partial [Planctomycetota bacterium]